MGSFTYISIAALFCYTFLFLTLLAAEKSRMINGYLLILGSMVLWTGGSLLMRIQFVPSTAFWFHVSIFGLMSLVLAYFVFVFAVIGVRRTHVLLFWTVALFGTWLWNVFTGQLLAPPNLLIGPGGEATFLYTYTWHVALLFIVVLPAFIHVALLLLRNLRESELTRWQFLPFALGIGVMVLGHLLILIPAFEGVPLDLFSGIVNAGCLFYGLYRRNLFRLTLLISRGSCYLLAGAMSLAIFTQLLGPLNLFLVERLPLLAQHNLLVISLLFTLATFALSNGLKYFLDHVFVRDEIAQAEQIREFSAAISRSLNIAEILDCIVDIIQKIIGPSKIYIFIADEGEKRFRLAFNSGALESRAPSLSYEHPIVEWVKKSDGCLRMIDFHRSTNYKAVWQQERQLLEQMEIECMAPLKDGDALVGIIMLTKKPSRKGYNYSDTSLLESINSISSIAITNSRLYKKAYIEARTDEVTGLYNRKYFYELLDAEFEKSRGQSLALCLLSVDDLKLYNQLYGYREGDVAIASIAEIISGCVGENGHVARHSGKVFAIILPRYDLRSARLLAENIRTQVMNMNCNHKDYAIRNLTLSGGIAAIPYSADSPKTLFEHADLALFHVKHNGKNAILAYTNGDYGLEKTRASVEEQRMAYSEYENTIYALMAAIDAKDHYTFNHSMNVLYYATKLAEAMNMNTEYIEIIREAALLHDIGKIGIPENILNKTGSLTEEEYEVMKGHVEQSITMIKFLPSLDYVIPTVIGHHERYDGKGYPRGLKGEDIPLGARILCVADSFDAMMSKRSYKLAYPLEQALSIMEEEAGRQFDPQMASIFVRLVRSGKIEVKSLGGSESGISAG